MSFWYILWFMHPSINLRNDGDPGSEVMEADPSYVNPIDHDPSLGCFQNPEDSQSERGFSSSSSSNNSHLAFHSTSLLTSNSNAHPRTFHWLMTDLAPWHCQVHQRDGLTPLFLTPCVYTGCIKCFRYLCWPSLCFGCRWRCPLRPSPDLYGTAVHNLQTGRLLWLARLPAADCLQGSMLPGETRGRMVNTHNVIRLQHQHQHQWRDFKTQWCSSSNEANTTIWCDQILMSTSCQCICKQHSIGRFKEKHCVLKIKTLKRHCSVNFHCWTHSILSGL